MNFFAHATVASWERSEPAFVLGAMLPDFASMTGRRLRGSGCLAVAAGVKLHLRTDSVFHDCAGFRELWLEATRSLRESGVPRGAARGAAHVGIELLLDGALVGDAHVAGLYEGALRAGADDELRASLRWSHEDGDARWRSLCSRLAAQGVPFGYREPDRVAERVERVLSYRPRLALEPRHRSTLRGWLAGASERVNDAAPALLEQVRAGLAASPGRP